MQTSNEEPIGEVVAPPPAGGGNTAILSVIERVALDPSIDIAKLERMLDMQERILERNAKAEFAADFVRMKPHLPKVVRTKDNIQTKSKYAPLEEINTVIDPVLERFGFGTSTKILSQTPESVTLKAELWHRGGHIEDTTVTMPLDNKGPQGTVNKTLPHATSSSVMYGRRVAICALLNVSTGDDKDGNDPDGKGNAVLTHEKAVEIDMLIAEAGADKSKFLSFMGVEDVRDIKARDYAKAKNALNAKKKGSK